MENRFDLYDLPEGHEERFQAKLEPRLARARRLTRVFRWTAIAACLAAVLWLGSRTRSPFWSTPRIWSKSANSTICWSTNPVMKRSTGKPFWRS